MIILHFFPMYIPFFFFLNSVRGIRVQRTWFFSQCTMFLSHSVALSLCDCIYENRHVNMLNDGKWYRENKKKIVDTHNLHIQEKGAESKCSNMWTEQKKNDLWITSYRAADTRAFVSGCLQSIDCKNIYI